MIDIKELRKDKRPQSSIVVHALLDRLEAAESEALEQARLNGMGAEREAALLAKLEAAEKDIAVKEEVIDSLAAVVKRLDAQCDAAERERDAMRAKVAAMEKERDALRTAVRHEADCVEAAMAEIKSLRAELETERMRLAACGVVALSNTPDSAKQARDMLPEYWSASCGDVARMVDENISLRAKIDAMEQQEPVAWMLNCPTLGGDTGWILSWTQSGAGLCNRLQGEENEKRLYTLPGAKGEEK